MSKIFFTKNVRKALTLAYKAHANQVDIGGAPFIFHPLYVAMSVPDEDDEPAVVALLHDILEKTDVRIEDLIVAGFSSRVISSVKVLTYDGVEPFQSYINRIKQDPLARIVAIHAIMHNLDTERYAGIVFTEEQFDAIEELQEGYEDAYRILTEGN